MPPRNVNFTPEQEEKLIMEVERRPILWDVKCDLYKRSDLKPSVWEEIASNLGPLFSGEAVSTRFKNMRDTYFSNKRKVTASKNKCSGAGGDDLYKPKWVLFPKLQFLDRTAQKCPSTSNMTDQQVQGATSAIAGAVDLTPLQKDMMLTRKPEPQATPVVNPLAVTASVPLQTEPQATPTVVNPFAVTASVPLQAEPQEVTYFDDTLNHYVTVAIDAHNVEEENHVDDPSVVSNVEPSPGNNLVSEDAMGPAYEKRGAKKRKQNKEVLEEAVSVLKDLCRPVPSDPQPDPADTFSTYVASRLRALDADKRRQCEDAILRILMSC